MNLAIAKNNHLSWFGKKNLLIFALLLIPIVFLLTTLVRTELAMLMMAGIVFVLLFVFNFNITLKVLILAFFVDYLFMNFRVSVLFIPIVLISFLLTQHSFKKEDYTNPLTKYFMVYLLTCIPSAFNNIALGSSLIIATQFLAFLVLIYTLAAYIKEVSQIDTFIKMFLILSLLNAGHVIVQVAITGGRKFGFAGIMYVDYVNIAIIINLLYVVLKKESKLPKFVYLITLTIFTMVSVLMQTRNSWISIALTFGLLVVYLYNKSQLYGMNKTKIFYFVSVIVILLGITIAFIVSETEFSDRVTDIEIKEEINIEEDIGNSLLTRMLIWDTALSCFLAHPMTGVGMYAFPLVSSQYTQVPDILYEKYVENLTPHVGYFAVLAETGVIGFMGFVLMLFMIIRTANSIIKKSRSEDKKLIATILLWVLVYITVSLSMTDAWLWGVGIIVWGFFIGLMLGMNKIINKSAENS
ncbi:MAG: O-antigen ligase family protein [Ignavibacteriaceae bacterium]